MIYDYADKTGFERGVVFINGVKSHGSKPVKRIYKLVGIDGKNAIVKDVDRFGREHQQVLKMDTIEKLDKPIERF